MLEALDHLHGDGNTYGSDDALVAAVKACVGPSRSFVARHAPASNRSSSLKKVQLPRALPPVAPSQKLASLINDVSHRTSLHSLINYFYRKQPTDDERSAAKQRAQHRRSAHLALQYLRKSKYLLFSFCQDSATLQFSEDEMVDLVCTVPFGYVYIYADYFGETGRRFDSIGEMTCEVARAHANPQLLDQKRLNRLSGLPD